CSEPIRSTPPRASTRSSVMSNRRYLKLVLPRLATRIFTMGFLSCRLRLCTPRASLAEERVDDIALRARDDVRGNQLAVGAGRLGARIDGGADRADVAAHEGRHERAADLHLAGQR